MKLIKLLTFCLAALVVTSVTYSNHSLDDSQKVADLSREISELEKSNVILRAKVAKQGSLTTIASKIEELGFISAKEIASLNVPGMVASR